MAAGQNISNMKQIETIQQRRALLAAGKIFAGTEFDIEGNLRQRRYRFDRVTEWLANTFSKTLKNQTDAELAWLPESSSGDALGT